MRGRSEKKWIDLGKKLRSNLHFFLRSHPNKMSKALRIATEDLVQPPWRLAAWHHSNDANDAANSLAESGGGMPCMFEFVRLMECVQDNGADKQRCMPKYNELLRCLAQHL